MRLNLCICTILKDEEMNAIWPVSKIITSCFVGGIPMATAVFSEVIYANNSIHVKRAVQAIEIDGIVNETAWQEASWLPIDKQIIGSYPTPDDFSASYKLLWDKDYLYVLVKLFDNVLYDAHPDPLIRYWDDDCLEVFIDEDNSKGEHLANFNAFAYHIALDNQVVDIAPSIETTVENEQLAKQRNRQGEPKLFNHHIDSQWQRSLEVGNPFYWELAVKLYNDRYVYQESNAERYRVSNVEGKKIGFMLAYCDNDGSEYREHFIGSTDIIPVNGDKNLGYKTADVFDTLILVGDDYFNDTKSVDSNSENQN
ncbi:sugar-binding protein [Thalassotalea euphylliae]|uniref:Sugar-binding protein n=2 Tax=Thalassotalea euphylliae TaxID=1655234 RepID=A0A3E0UIU2_9GAMM|nr:sugar-binding protein [Thalassotalea euphylliae]